MRTVKTAMSLAFACLRGIVEDYTKVFTRLFSSLADMYHGPVIYGTIVYAIAVHAGHATTITSQVSTLVDFPGEVYVRDLIDTLTEHGHKIDILEIGTWSKGTLVRTIIQADTLKVCTTFIPAENNFTKRKFGRVSLLPEDDTPFIVGKEDMKENNDDNMTEQDDGFWRNIPIEHRPEKYKQASDSLANTLNEKHELQEIKDTHIKFMNAKYSPFADVKLKSKERSTNESTLGNIASKHKDTIVVSNLDLILEETVNLSETAQNNEVTESFTDAQLSNAMFR